MAIRQLEHVEITNKRKSFPLVVVAENISSPANAGMIFRVCEAFGVKHIFFTGYSLELPNNKVTKVSRSTVERVPYTTGNNILEIILKLQMDGFTAMALEIASNSTFVHQTEFNQYTSIALVIGSESHGVSDEILQLMDANIAIQMFGNNTSINVVSALGIGLYEITKQWNQKLY